MSHVSVPVDTSLFLRLAAFLEGKGSKRDPATMVTTAIQYWIDNAEWKPDDLLPETSAQLEGARGYRWKSLFLPDRTDIRMRYKGQYHYAKIVGDDFTYNDEKTSPSQFAARVTGSSRNAWRDLEIKRPHDTSWRLADEMR